MEEALPGMERIEMNGARDPELSILRPYNGSHHILPDGCPKVLPTFPGDESARVSYAFNSLGFRGEEFRITADRHVFVCGGSVTLGLGLEYEDAWVSAFRRGYEQVHDAPAPEVNLLNFSSSGCSNSYIARTLIGQCVRFAPTLVLAELTFSHRSEVLHNGRSYNIGPWCLLDDYEGAAGADGHHAELRRMIRRKAQAYYALEDQLLAGQDLLKNALLLQLFFQSRNIPYLIGLSAPAASDLPDDELLAPWLDSLDPERVFTIAESDYQADQSAVSGHPGPAGSAAIAESFLSRYKESYVEDPPSRQVRTSEQSRSGWKRWLSEKLKGPEKEDRSIYPLY